MIDTKELIERTKDVLSVSTQGDIAKHFEVSNKSVSEWKNGNATPPYKKFIELAESRSINLNWYFYGIGDKMSRNVNNGFLNNQIGNDNHFYISIGKNTTDAERQEIEEIAKYIDYAPRAFVNMFIDKLQSFKKQCELA